MGKAFAESPARDGSVLRPTAPGSTSDQGWANGALSETTRESDVPYCLA